ncbi:putative inorganic carbon transporter subunit DabA [Agromyces arachidis]|uniref:putative inorganic carbon transporter subunit DabA n=1 Tax=Agromyces arachidis TaxID=766966 RepID=UPI00405615E4
MSASEHRTGPSLPPASDGSTGPSPETRRAVIRGMIAAADRVVAPHRPLTAFIARNPLAGYERWGFADAAARAAEEHGTRLTLDEPAFRLRHRAGAITDDDLRAALERHVVEARDRTRRSPSPGRHGLSVADILLADLSASPPAEAPARTLRTPSEHLDPRIAARIDDLAIRWVTAHLGIAHAAWAPARDEAFWPRWRRLAAHDPTVPRRVRRGIRALGEHAEDAVADALAHWRLLGDDAERFLRAQLVALPGLAGHVADAAGSGRGIDVVDLVALRATYERLLVGHPPSPRAGDLAPRADRPEDAPARPEDARVDAVLGHLGLERDDAASRATIGRVLGLVGPQERTGIWQEALDLSAARTLAPPRSRAGRSTGAEAGAEPAGDRPFAQAVFCIDPRSEGLRRAVEVEAGGHGLDVETLGFAGFFAVAMRWHDLEGDPPTAACPVLLEPRTHVSELAADADRAARYRDRVHKRTAAREVVARTKASTVAPFALAETAGWPMGVAAALRTARPRAWARIVDAWNGRSLRPATRADADAVYPLDERVAYAETALRMMGLVDGFARLVLLAGHGADTANNPFASALHCGACGGHRGGPNARAAAAMLNDPGTRSGLAASGIRIPEDTVFVAVEHDTVTDRVEVCEPWAIPASHLADLSRVEAVLAAARAASVRERLATLPGAPKAESATAQVDDADRRAADWSEAYPEWGLAGNAALIVAPRRATRGLDLGRRAFLHSYEAAADPDGSALETILTAPMIVAQWINAQYLASTVDPDRWGAGPKPLANVVGDVAVQAGYGGDLRTGLPWQSVGVGRDPVHDPVRLQVFVQAPVARVCAILDRSGLVRGLLDGGWIALRVRARESDPWLRYGPFGWTRDGLGEPVAAAAEPADADAARADRTPSRRPVNVEEHP